jgi:signal transduction histidine kinase
MRELADEREETRERLVVIGEIAAEVAHELRNVLQIISASAYVARQDVDRGDATAAKPHVVKIEKHTRIAHAIVDDLMGLARGEPLQSEPILLVDAIAVARDDLAEAAAWDDTFEPRGIRLRAHPGLLARMFHVLYENAIHASAPRVPTIVTRARIESGRVVIEVADDGPGVPEAIAARIFEPLVTARAGGTGLGLSLARRIAMAHAGAITLLDPVASPGATPPGATFRVELPGSG